MKSVLLINPSGREVSVADNRAHHLLTQGFTLAPEKAEPAPVVLRQRPVKEEEPPVDLDELTRGELVQMAEAAGLSFHPLLGEKKLRALLSE